MQNNIGIALSGGGVRGFAHLGVLKALEEMSIKVSLISGTSAGAIIGAFYAAGYKPDHIASILESEKLFSFSNLLWRKAGVFNMNSFQKTFEEYFPEDSFEKLTVPLIVTATDIQKGELVYFSSGSLSKALLASSCVPVIFEPVDYNGRLFVDGGILNNLPVEPMIRRCERIIGVYVNGISEKKDTIGMKDIMDRSFHLALSSSIKAKSKLCNLFIEPLGLDNFGMFDMKDASKIFTIGYEYTMSLRSKIINLTYSMK